MEKIIIEQKKVLEKALRIQAEIDKLELKVRVGVGNGHRGNDPYLFLQKIGSADSEHFRDSLNVDDKEFIETAKEMCKPKFIQLKRLCIDSFDIDLYLDKQERVRVKSILSKEVALLTDSREIEINRLWIKE